MWAGNLSPFLIPLGGMLIAIVAIVAGVAGEAHKQRLRADQRLAMLARGMSVDDIDRLLGRSNSDAKAPRDPIRSLANTRRTAIVLISSGLGLVLFFVILTLLLHENDILTGAAVGVVPIMIGLGFWLDYHLQKRDLSRFGLEVGSSE